MEYTGYLDFWFTDRPIVERVESFVALGITRFDVWFWRNTPIAEIAAETEVVDQAARHRPFIVKAQRATVNRPA